MPTITEWQQLIEALPTGTDAYGAIEAQTVRGSFPTYSRPVVFGCNDGQEWVAKGLREDRSLSKALVTEHVVGRIGHLLGAPIPSIAFVNVPAALVRLSPEAQGLQPGLAHGSCLVPDVSGRMGIAHAPFNATRFAPLHVLYSWTHSQDDQWIYDLAAPHSVYSVDHGHFLPGGPNWTSQSLSEATPPRRHDAFNNCGLTRGHYTPVIDRLEAIGMPTLAEIVASPPPEWGCTSEERANLGEFLHSRIPAVIHLFQGV